MVDLPTKSSIVLPTGRQVQMNTAQVRAAFSAAQNDISAILSYLNRPIVVPQVTAAQTLPGLQQTITAAVARTMMVNQSLASLQQALVGAGIDQATVSQALGALGQTLTGTAPALGTANLTVAQALGALTQISTATGTDKAAVAQALGGLTQTLTAKVTDKAAVSQSLGVLIQAATIQSGFDSVAELPRSTPDTTMPTITGSTFTVTANSFSSLQAQVNAAAATAGSGNHLINVPPGTYSGNLNLPARTGSGWIVIQSTGTLPAQGTRVQASNIAQLAQIVGPGASSADRAMNTTASTHHWRLVGISFTQSGTTTTSGMVDVGQGGSNQTGIDVHHVGFDRCLVTGREPTHNRLGIGLNCGEAFVIDSSITKFVNDGTQDSKAIGSWDGTGPFLIQNNDLSSTAECTLFGGNDPATPGRNPADITIRHNTYFKDPAWVGLGYGIKNLAENKKGIRVLYEYNIFKQCYTDPSGDTQDGQVFNLISRNQGGTDTTSITRDVTIRNNVAFNCNKFATANGSASTTTKGGNYSIHDNLIYAIGHYNGQDSLRPYLIQMTWDGQGLLPVVIKNNTMICDSSEFYTFQLYTTGSGVKGDSLVFTDNICSTGSITAVNSADSGGGQGTAALNFSFTTYTFQNNLFIGSYGGVTHPTPNTIVANIAAAGLASTAPTAPADFAATSAPSTTSGTGGGPAGVTNITALIAATGV
jgi:hypothetical protein